MSDWIFAEIQGADVRRAPQEAELFKSEQAQEGEYSGTDALVREVLQNSLDASSGSGPIRVRIALHEADEAPTSDRLVHYFSRLQSPLQAKRADFDTRDVRKNPCRFLVCEDFGTRGLQGDPSRFSDPPNGHGNEDFYWFWRNIGRSGKTGQQLGRWGLGKLVYRAASRVGCMLGLTVRLSDAKRLLMGQAVISVHKDADVDYQPEGFWCDRCDHRGLPLPIEEAVELDRFCKEWKLTRRFEPGLSVVAPFVHEELKADRVVQAVIVNFLTRILRRQLIVEVVGTELGTVLLDADGIEAACKRISWAGPRRMKRHEPPPISFVRRCLTSPPKGTTEILGSRRLPELGEDAIATETLQKLRREFAAGELVGIKVRLNLPRSVGDAETGELFVHLQRDLSAAAHDAYYVREGMTITKLNAAAGRKGVRSLVLVEEGPLASLLGDTEGPAHEDWLTSATRPDATWKTWKGRVTFVRKVVDHLAELLTPTTTEPDFDLLTDFFSLSDPSGAQRSRSPSNDPEDRDEDSSFPTPPPPTPKWFRIYEREGGFTIGRCEAAPMPQEPMLRVSMAYDISRGDPLRNWSPFDFRIAPDGLKPRFSGLRARQIEGNVVEIVVQEDSFDFKLDGFDPHRDLFVRVDDISGQVVEEVST